MIKSIHLFLILAFVGVANVVIAQPQHTYIPGNTATQSGPFRSSTLNLKQNLYYPSDFSGAPASGFISTLYVMSDILTVPSSTFSTLTVKMGPTTLNAFTSGPFVTGLTTVLNDTNATINAIAGDWMVINLSTPYYYDNTQNLIIEFSQTGYSPGFYTETSGGSIAPNRSLSGSTSSSTGNSQARVMTLGFDISTSAPCNAPTGLQISNIGIDSAVVSWDSVASASGYEYEVSTSASSPASGILTTDTFYHANSLSANTWYYTHVRADCGSTFSPWAVDSFLTPMAPCLPVMPVATNVTDSSADISWATSTVAVNYEYGITNSATPPATSTLTSATSIVANGLTDSTLYYVHVRSICTADTSAWSSISFTTLKDPTVSINYFERDYFNVTVFPNPIQASLTIYIKGNESNDALITLTDMSGQVLKTVKINYRRNVTLDTHSLKAGIYLIRYQDESHNEVVRVIRE